MRPSLAQGQAGRGYAGGMRIVGWNIRAGAGRRVQAIAAQLAAWEPDIVVLSEYRGTPPSAWLAEALAARGLVFQRTTVDSRHPALNRLLLASRWPVRRVALRRAQPAPATWLPLRVDAPRPLVVAGMHIPNEVTGRKWSYLDAVAGLAQEWRAGPALLIGDTNSGRPGLDEENPVFGPRYAGWFNRVEGAGWRDAFRHLHGDRLEYTWYSPNGGNGFRLDQAFVNRALLPRLAAAQHAWGGDGTRRDELSDHAALIVDLEE